MNIESILITDIRTDGGTQPRVELDHKTVEEYAESMRNGALFPAVTVFLDDQDIYWLADGFHRLEAAKILKLDRIGAEVQRGSQRDAILYSFSANASHGLRRNRADVRQAIERLLTDPEWGKWSDREIANRCVVSHHTVAKVREELLASGQNAQMTSRKFIRDGKEYTMNTAGINADREPESPADPDRADPVETRPEDESWFTFYFKVQREHPNETVFMAVGTNSSIWLVMGDQARRVAEQIGDRHESHQVGKIWTPMLKLWMGEPSRIDRLEAKIGPVYHYLDNDPDLRQLANQMHTADIREPQPEQAALNISAVDTLFENGVDDSDGSEDADPDILCSHCQQPTKPMITGERVCTHCGQILSADGEETGERDASVITHLQGTADDAPVLREAFLNAVQEWLPELIALGQRAVESEKEANPDAETGETAALLSKLTAFTHLFLGDVETAIIRPVRFVALRKQIQESKTQRQLDDLLKAVHGLSISAPLGFKGANAVVQTLVDEMKVRKAEIAAPAAPVTPASTATQEASSAAL